MLYKACSIAKTTIAVRKLDVFDWTVITSILAIENVVFDNVKRKILHAGLSPIRCEPGLAVTKRSHAQFSLALDLKYLYYEYQNSQINGMFRFKLLKQSFVMLMNVKMQTIVGNFNIYE